MNSDQLLDLATDRHRAGDLPEARRLYRETLAHAPANAVALIRSGLLELQDGHAEAALSLIESGIAAAPGKPRYEFVHGQVLATLARWEEAAAAYRRSLQFEPNAADVNFALGVALQSSGDLNGAIGAYESATEYQADFADAFNNIGNCHQLLGELSQAEIAYRQAIGLNPNHAEAMSNLGTVLQRTGQLDEAVALLRIACELEPAVSGYAVNLGAALCEQRKFSDAKTVLRPIVELDRTNAQAAYNIGNALRGLGQLREAAEEYRRATKLKPDYADALNNLGTVYKELGEFKLAATAYADAIRAQPDSVIALNNYGCLLRTLGRLEEAESILRRGIDRDADHPALHNNLGNVLKDVGELDEAIESFRRALALDPTDASTHSNLAYALSFCAVDGKTILDECLRWNAMHAVLLQSEIVFHVTDQSPNRRLRIGYVSPDFRDHCQSLFTVPLLSHHDHSDFEIYCYSSVERPDDFTRRIAGYADRWCEIRLLDDATVCDLIRSDKIDILVDLTMHMANGRPLIFALKPAPIQIAWLAYPGTTGISAMDFRLSDPRLDPPEFDSHYSERTIRLPDSFWCYDPLTREPAVNELPALSRGFITLGCLNNPCKLTDHTLLLWGQVMRLLPTARLMLIAAPGAHRQHLRGRLAANGIAAERIEFIPFRPRVEYLRSYHQIDLGLDTFPYNGHTTTLDSLWMGVPVVTRIGPTCVGRAGLSQLYQLDLVELACETNDAFVHQAVALASDLDRLAKLRRDLRPRLERSPLMDGARFAKNIEAIYRHLSLNVDIGR